VNPIALDAIQWKFYFVYIGTLAAMLPTIWFLFPETKGRTLEEIAVVFDGPGVNHLGVGDRVLVVASRLMHRVSPPRRSISKGWS
jgi:hypothetical protein